MPTIADEIERLDRVILASEDWAKSYKKNPEALAKLIKKEAKLARLCRAYFKDLANNRASNFINWQIYQSKAVKGYSFDVLVDVDEIDSEYDTFISVIHDPILELIALGATTAEVQYNIDLGLNQFSDSILKANTKYVGDLVKGITNTTKDRIKSSINSSITKGENIDDAIKRLREVIRDPYRAEMIARTETVSAYTEGIKVFGEESNATYKIWELSSDPCEICLENYGQTPDGDGRIPFDDDFIDGEPPAHPNCRCSMSLEHSYE